MEHRAGTVVDRDTAFFNRLARFRDMNQHECTFLSWPTANYLDGKNLQR
jgi:hypothetical protein